MIYQLCTDAEEEEDAIMSANEKERQDATGEEKATGKWVKSSGRAFPIIGELESAIAASSRFQCIHLGGDRYQMAISDEKGKPLGYVIGVLGEGEFSVQSYKPIPISLPGGMQENLEEEDLISHANKVFSQS